MVYLVIIASNELDVMKVYEPVRHNNENCNYSQEGNSYTYRPSVNKNVNVFRKESF